MTQPVKPGPMSLREPLHSLLAAARAFLRARLRRGGRYGLGVTLALLAIGAALWGFLEIVDTVTEAELVRTDERVRGLVGGLTRPAFTPWMAGLTELGNGWIVTVVSVVLALGLALRRQWRRAFEVAVVMGGGGLLIGALKLFFARARPAGALVETSGYSFPSGHSFAAMTLYGLLVVLVWQATMRPALRTVATALGGALILAIGVSRVYLGVHWLTDVLGGFLAGFAWLVASLLLVRWGEGRRSASGRLESP